MFLRPWLPVLAVTCSAFCCLAYGCGGGDSPPVFGCSTTEFVPNYSSDLMNLVQWPSLPVTVAFLQDNQFTAAREADARAGFDRWVSVTGGRLDYQVISDPGIADVTVSFDPRMVDSVTALTGTDQFLVHAAMTIGLANPADPRLLIPPGDVQCAAAHEFGHSLGIEGHSRQPGDLMYFAHVVGSSCPITQRDLNTIRSAYCGLFPAPGTILASSRRLGGPTSTVTFHCIAQRP